MMEKPVLAQFGAGNIGRSLVARLFSAAGWRVVFLDVFQPVIDALNTRGGYEIVIKDDLLPGQPGVLEVNGVSGVSLSDSEKAVQTVRRADIVSTSVGAGNLPSVCDIIARALDGRTRRLPVLLCENLHNAAAIAGDLLRQALPPASALGEKAAFVEAAISTMVPAPPPEVRAGDPLVAWAEAYSTLYLDGDAYSTLYLDGDDYPGTPPDIPGIAWRGDFAAYVDRKLFVHNFGHAAAAYHGFLAGHSAIWECMADPAVRAETAGCMMETSRALAARHSRIFTFDENRAWADDLLRRFHNRALADPVVRVGRDLRRKLAPGDRCIGALRLLLATGVEYTHTARAIAAALLFAPETEDAHPGDSDVARLAAGAGPEAVLTGLCGLDMHEDREAISIIAREYRRLAGRGGSDRTPG